jgi:hypothetical protein
MATIRGKEYAWRPFEYLVGDRLGNTKVSLTECVRIQENTKALEVVYVTVSTMGQ